MFQVALLKSHDALTNAVNTWIPPGAMCQLIFYDLQNTHELKMITRGTQSMVSGAHAELITSTAHAQLHFIKRT